MRQRLRFHTLRGRLTFVAVLGATVAVVAGVIAFNVVLDRLLDVDVDRRLRTRASAVATTVRSGDGGVISVRDGPDDGALDERVWVFSRGRAVLSPRSPTSVARAARQLAGRDNTFLDVGDNGTRLYAHAITREGRQIGTVVTAESLAAYDRTTDLAHIATVVLGGALLIGVLGVTWLVIGRALAPVTEMTRSAAEWSEHDQTRRFGSRPRPDELGDLAVTFDALLDRVAASLRHEQRLSAELSHELRTPLARISAELELLQRRERSPEELAAAHEVIGRSSAQMQRLLETLMAAARAEASSAPGRSELGESLEDLEMGWTDPLHRRGVTLEIPADRSLVVGADHDLVERILSPLIDNAGRYARSRIRIAAERAGSTVSVSVSDDGPGIAPGQRTELFEPGSRGPAGDGQDRHSGAGLGLALARRLARSAGGDLVLGENGAGATFVVTLPA
jgi:signal transduction histidine kinase